LIWQLQKHHASETSRLQAELRSMWREFSSLRDGLSGSTPRAVALKPPSVPATPTAPSPALTKEVDQLRSEVRSLSERSASAERTAHAAAEAVGALREEVRRCASEASERAFRETRSRTQLQSEEAELVAAQDNASDSLEQRLRTLEEMSCGIQQTTTQSENGCEMRAQVAALERQVGHLQDLCGQVGHIAEQDQAALRPLLRTSRLLAERLGIGPVLLGRERLGRPSLAEEAEGLAAGVAAAWRRQKASGAVPTGATNVLEAIRLQKSETGSPQRQSAEGLPLKRHVSAARETDRQDDEDASHWTPPLECGDDGSVGATGPPLHCRRHHHHDTEPRHVLA